MKNKFKNPDGDGFMAIGVKNRPLTDTELSALLTSLKSTGTTQYDPVELLLSNLKTGATTTFEGKEVIAIPWDEMDAS